jgi:hypothetical protein
LENYLKQCVSEAYRQVSQVEALSLEQMEELSKALLDFTSLDDLQDWLTQ